MSTDRVAQLGQLYERFNARDIDAVLALLHPEVDWQNGWEGGREHGREAVRAYWTRQWTALDPRVELMDLTVDADGRVRAQVHQTARSLEGELLWDGLVEHLYEFEDGLIRRMEIASV